MNRCVSPIPRKQKLHQPIHQQRIWQLVLISVRMVTMTRTPRTPKGKNLEQKLKFNPARYDCLDEAPFDAWIREFLIRNREFRKDVLHFMDLFKENHDDWEQKRLELYNKYKVDLYLLLAADKPKEDVSIEDNEFFDSLRKWITVPLTIRALRILEDEEAQEEYEKKIQRIKKQIEKEGCNSDDWHFHYGGWFHYKSVGFQLDTTKKAEYLFDALFGLGSVLSDDRGTPYHHGNTLLLSINLNRTREEIEYEFNKVLELHKERRKGSIRMDVWKYYLIVYDLRKQGLSFNEITDELLKVYPNNRNLFEKRNIENYYHKAKKLIDSDFKKFI
jgi:hypothetical protein